jgi:hypothetical protein
VTADEEDGVIALRADVPGPRGVGQLRGEPAEEGGLIGIGRIDLVPRRLTTVRTDQIDLEPGRVEHGPRMRGLGGIETARPAAVPERAHAGQHHENALAHCDVLVSRRDAVRAVRVRYRPRTR